MNKNVKLEPDIAKRVQDWANKNCNGNSTQAINKLLSSSLLAEQMAEAKKNG